MERDSVYLLDVYKRQHNGFGNDGNALQKVSDKLGTLDGVFSCIFQQQIGFEADKVRFILLYEGLELRRIRCV